MNYAFTCGIYLRHLPQVSQPQEQPPLLRALRVCLRARTTHRAIMSIRIISTGFISYLLKSFYNKKDDVKMSWIYNGREDVRSMGSVGLLFRDLPVALRLNNDRTLRDLYLDVHEQVSKAIKYSCYPYVDKDAQVVANDVAYLLYQQDMRDGGDFGDMEIETVEIRQNQAASQTVLDIEILDGEEGLETMIDYASSRYNDESMVKFKDLFLRTAHAMVKYTAQHDVTVGELKKETVEDEGLLKKFVSIFKRKE